MLSKADWINRWFAQSVAEKENAQELSIKLSPWAQQRLTEIAQQEKARTGRKRIGRGRLIELAVARYIRAHEIDKLDHVPYPIPKEEIDSYDLYPENKAQPDQAYIPSDGMDALDKIAEKQGRNRSNVVRDAVYILIEYHKKHRSLEKFLKSIG